MGKLHTSLNAKVAAIAFPLRAIGLHILNQIEASLLPLRLLMMAILIFGVWAFSDEMGLRKPLNRAGFVSFLFAMGALLALTLEPSHTDGKYFLIYAFGMLFCILIWSAAFLHRQKTMKLVGAVGALASSLPVLMLVGGHISLGFGAIFGLNILFDLPKGESLLGSLPLNTIEGVFVVWLLFVALVGTGIFNYLPDLAQWFLSLFGGPVLPVERQIFRMA